MIIFRFIVFLLFLFLQGVDVFLFMISIYFLYEVFVGYNLGFLGALFFCGSWGFILCLLRIFIISLIYWGGGILNFYKRSYVFLLWLIFVSLMFCFKINNFFLFYLRFEFVVVPIFLIILMYGYRIDRVLASLYIFLYTLFTSLPFLLFLFYNDFVLHSFNLVYRELVERVDVFYCW